MAGTEPRKDSRAQVARVIPLRPPRQPPDFGALLLREGLVAAPALLAALELQGPRRGGLAEVLLAHGLISEAALLRGMSMRWQAQVVDLVARPPDARLIDRIGATACLAAGLVPWARIGGATVVVTARPEAFRRARPGLEAALGPVVMALAPLAAVQAAVAQVRAGTLATLAETRVTARDSCRSLPLRALPLRAALAGALLLALLLLAPVALAMAVTFVALFTMAALMALKTACLLSAPREPAVQPPPLIARLPVVSVMVPLFGEGCIAARLVARLGRIDYPRELLDVLLVTEAEDDATRRALAAADLPPWMRTLTVPPGTLKTKPRALNYALDFCRGSIVGVYDAEDAPAPDQIARVVDRFHQRDEKVACLQGVLDFYNPRRNWLARCFTMEYAGWFRIILPGLQRLGLPLPLGGTTLFFRRDALEALGGWDAHNVTEDADLGMRLARRGYRTEVIDTVTHEEANCAAYPWIKQRSRWIKGYMLTWAVHMRAPARLWRELGPRGFLGFQVLFLGTLSQFLLAPVLWSLWVVPLGLPHPVAAALPPAAIWTIAGMFALTELANISIGVAGLRRTGHGFHPAWVPTLYLYFPLAALASYKAAWEILCRPFYWDKTAHGRFDRPAPAASPVPVPPRALFRPARTQTA